MSNNVECTTGPLTSISDEITARHPDRDLPDNAVRVTAADVNMALPWERMFDSPPFSRGADWLIEALSSGRIHIHNRGSTDYAQWDVETPNGIVNSGPGDIILVDGDGALWVQHSSTRYIGQ